MSFQTFVLQRLSAITAAINAINTNAKKIDELPIQQNLDVESKIHVAKNGISQSLKISKIIESIQNSNYNHIISIGTITLADNILTIPAGVQWLINNINHIKITSVAFTIPYCAANKIRLDLIVANTSNEIVLIQGIETLGVAIQPSIPLDTVLVTTIHVTDSEVNNNGSNSSNAVPLATNLVFGKVKTDILETNPIVYTVTTMNLKLAQKLNIPNGTETDYIDGTGAIKPFPTSSGWGLTGNSGTNETTNFIGTTDNKTLLFKTNGIKNLRLNTNGTSTFLNNTSNSSFLADSLANVTIISETSKATAQLDIVGGNTFYDCGTGAASRNRLQFHQGIRRYYDVYGYVHYEDCQTIAAQAGSVQQPVAMNFNVGYYQTKPTPILTLYQNQWQTNVGIGTEYPNSQAKLEIVSTTGGLLLPRMTTTQKNAINGTDPWGNSTVKGMVVYDTTLNKLCVRGNTGWETITSA